MKNHRYAIIFVVIGLGSFLSFIWLTKQPFFASFVAWSQHHFVIYFTVLVAIKALGIVWPPIPGGLLTFGSIPVIGWLNAYIAEVCGGLIGASIAHYLGRRFGEKFLKKIFDEDIIARVKKIKIVKQKELEATFMLRLFTGSISEVISYGLGLLGVRYRNFIAGTAVAYVMLLPIFYMANNIFSGKNIIINGAIFLVMGALFYKLKGRYFE